MSNKYYAVVGRWNFAPGDKGIAVYSYDPETAAMELLGEYDPQVTGGQQYFDDKRKVLYIVDECEGKPGSHGGGGFIRAYKIDPDTGALHFMNEQCVLMTKPSYFWLDKSGDYAMVSAHTGRQGVTKIVRGADGKLSSTVVFEDVGVALMRINADGSLGEVCDVALYNGLTPLKRQVHSHPHSVMADPNCEVYYACDKGLDMVYSYKIDKERGRIIRLAETVMDFASAPRYVCFHPTLPVMYENNETSDTVYAMNYCRESGRLETVNKLRMNEGEDTGMASDIVITHDGAYVYVGQRGVDLLTAFRTHPRTGALELMCSYPAPGGIRGMTISPDGRFLLTANQGAGKIFSYLIGADGSLTENGAVDAPMAGNIGIVQP